MPNCSLKQYKHTYLAIVLGVVGVVSWSLWYGLISLVKEEFSRSIAKTKPWDLIERKQNCHQLTLIMKTVLQPQFLAYDSGRSKGVRVCGAELCCCSIGGAMASFCHDKQQWQQLSPRLLENNKQFNQSHHTFYNRFPFLPAPPHPCPYFFIIPRHHLSPVI